MTYDCQPPLLNLFGEVVITHDDLVAWVAAVSPVHSTDRLVDHVVRSYDVAGKIKTAKLRGEFDARTAVRRAIWNARIAYGQII